MTANTVRIITCYKYFKVFVFTAVSFAIKHLKKYHRFMLGVCDIFAPTSSFFICGKIRKILSSPKNKENFCMLFFFIFQSFSFLPFRSTPLRNGSGRCLSCPCRSGWGCIGRWRSWRRGSSLCPYQSARLYN